MASAATNLMTAEEFYDWSHQPENRERRFELEHGEVVEMSLPGKLHCLVCGNASGILWLYRRTAKNGNVYTNDMGIVLERDPDTVRGPDVAYYLEKTKYEDQERKYPDTMPALVVEVLSPNDRIGKMQKRINRFLAKGVAMVWLLDPDSQTVTVYLPAQLPIVLEGDEEVGGQGVLPGFQCKAAEFFASEA
jgi:Uma2 family endonuclease